MTRSLLAVLAAALVLALSAGPHAQVESAGGVVNALAEEFAARQSTGIVPLAAARDVAPAMPASEAQVNADAAWADDLLRRLHAITPDRLTHQDAVTYAALDFDAQLMRDGAQYYWLESFITPYASPLTPLAGTLASRPLTSDADRQAYLDTLHALPITFAAYEARLRGQVQRGIVLPADELPLVLGLLRGSSAPPDASPFAVAPERLAALAATDRTRFIEEVNATLADVVRPAVDRLVAYVDGPYRARATAGVGVSRLPGGREYYQFLIRRHTGLDLTPEQIHRIGLDEVARLEAALDDVRREAGFSGSLAAFRDHLRDDARFRARSADEIADRMTAALRRIEPLVARSIPKTPSAPYGVKPLDPQPPGR